MHPDYLDYAVKEKVHPKARWHDIKFLARKHSGLALDRIYVKWCHDGSWCGWVVDFRDDVDLAEFKRHIVAVTVLGDRTVFIGITE